jgi:branched-chain amino acid transport system substrate-binding protein
MSKIVVFRNALFGAALAASAGTVVAQGSVKIGFIAEFAGPFAEMAQEMNGGVKAYLKQYGDTVAGKKIEFILRDTGGVAPEVAKRHAQELITRDKVDLLVGFVMTPNAAAVLPVSAEAKKPFIMMNSTTSGLTLKSPYSARVSQTIPQISVPLAPWALKNGIKRVFTIVADYAPGQDSEASFIKAFKAGGGEILGSVRVPLRNPDFAPFIQRAKDAKPDGVFVFLTGGDLSSGFIKSFYDRGLTQAGIRMFSAGEFLTEREFEALGEAAFGFVSTAHYNARNDSPQNKIFRKAYAEANNTQDVPAYIAVAAYDGTGAIFEALRQTNGSTDPDKIMAALKGMKIASPRGSITIDAETRDIVQTIYIREWKKVGNTGRNIDIDKFVDLKDPG